MTQQQDEASVEIEASKEQQQETAKPKKREHTFKGIAFHNDHRFAGVKANGNYFGKWVVSHLEKSGKVLLYMAEHMGINDPQRVVRQFQTRVSITFTFKEKQRMAEFLGVSFEDVIAHAFIEEPTLEQITIEEAGHLVEAYYHMQNRSNRNTLLTVAYTLRQQEENEEQ